MVPGTTSRRWMMIVVVLLLVLVPAGYGTIIPPAGMVWYQYHTRGTIPGTDCASDPLLINVESLLYLLPSFLFLFELLFNAMCYVQQKLWWVLLVPCQAFLLSSFEKFQNFKMNRGLYGGKMRDKWYTIKIN
jgi:hypothetical protein